MGPSVSFLDLSSMCFLLGQSYLLTLERFLAPGDWGKYKNIFLLLLLQFLALFTLYIFIQCLKATLYSQLLQNIDYIPHVVKYVLVVYLKPAWKIAWMEEPGRLQYMGSRRVGHDWATSLSLSLFTFMHWRRKWQPTPVFLPGESQGQGSLVACSLWGRTESDTTEAT